jgi:chromosome segregation ATPase
LKIRVKVTDLGAFRGLQEFTFDSEILNVIEGPNTAGKSSLIKGIVATLGLPAKSKLTTDVAKRLGLLPLNPEDRNPLVNTNAQQAVVELVNGQHRRLVAQIQGLPKIEPLGDDRFLLTGILLRESEIVRRLDDGFDDFSWLVDYLSLSSNYEVAKRMVEEYQIAARDRLDRLQTEERKVAELLQELNTLKLKREEIKEQRKKLEEQLNSVLIEDPSVIEEISRLRARRDEIEKEIGDIRSKINNLKVEREKWEAEIRITSPHLQELEEALNTAKEKLEKLPSKGDIEKAEKEAYELRKTVIPQLKEEIGWWRSKVELLEQAEKQLMKGMATVPCPLCQECQATPIGLISVTSLERALTQAREHTRNLESKLAMAIQKAEELEAKRYEVERIKKELSKQQEKIRNEFASVKNRFDKAKSELEIITKKFSNLNEELTRKQSELEEVTRQLTKLQERFGYERFSQLVNAIRRVESELGKVESRLVNLESEVITKNIVEVMGRPIQLAAAITLYQKWVDVLTDLNLYIEEMILRQRRGVARSFNIQVTRLLKEMGFEGLKVWIDESSFKLKVHRENVEQPLTSLSSSERHAIATVLTLAAKEVYASDIPFFLVDEVLLDFDKKRLTALSHYLKEMSKNHKVVVIVSRLGGDKLNVRGVEEL